MKKIIVSLFALSFLAASNVYAAPKEDVKSPIVAYTDAVEQIKEALALGDEALVAKLVSEAVAKNPSIAGKLASFVIESNPEYSVSIVKAIQAAAPKQEASVVLAITQELAKNPANADKVAQVLNQASPAARPNNAGNPQGTPAGLNNAINNLNNNRPKPNLPKGIVENPNINSEN